MSDSTEGPLATAVREAFENIKCWAVHIEGPDDVWAAPSKNIADFTVNVLNQMFDLYRLDPRPRAKVVEWSRGYEQWESQCDHFVDRLASVLKGMDPS